MSTEFNLLVLGQSGTGKSTWINSIANYLTYETFDDALNANDPKCLIPMTFYVTNDNYDEIAVSLGPADVNEKTEAGLSCTQKPRVYSFKCGNNTLNVVDVPGIGDTEGIEKDGKNIREILDTIGLFKELHAICIVLKATETRIGTEFSYCLSELLVHLHKNALNNAVFVITNSRASDYSPGNVRTPLKGYLEELERTKRIKVPLNRDTMYCIDNEAFRFQCCYYQHRSYRDKNPAVYAKAWNESRSATFRLITHMRQLRPHNVIETLSINEARAVILMLIQPLHDITTLIQRNVTNYVDNRDELVKQLQQNLAVSDFDIEIEELSRPRTVCTEKKCISSEKVAGTNYYTTHYKQICHATCYLRDIPLHCYPEPGLKRCAAMQSNENCQKCGCHHLKHMHIDYNQKTVLKKSVLTARLNNIKLTETMAADEIEKNIKEFEAEQKIVTQTMVKFGGFLQVNAILEYNGNIDERMKMEIRKAENTAEASKSETIVNRLKAVYEDFKKQQKELETTIKLANGKCEINAEQVVELRDELFKLPLFGGKIEELYNKGREKSLGNYGDKYFIKVQAKHMP
jgi:GTPase SAR1 family protein